MLYTSNLGKIYDTIFFFIEYFNKNEISSELKRRYGDISNMLELYGEVSESVGQFSTLISPFFQRSDGNISIMSSFFETMVTTADVTMEQFIDNIRNNSDMLYQKITDSIFSVYQQTTGKKLMPLLTPGNYIAAIDELQTTPEKKLQIALLFGNFNYTITVLIDSLRCVYAEIEKLHNNHKRELEHAQKNIQSESNQKMYVNALHIEESAIASSTASVSLLNPYIFFKSGDKVKPFLLLGLTHEIYFSDQYDERVTSPSSFVVTCGSELRMKLLQGLSENGEMTLTQLAQYADSLPTTVIRNLQILREGKIIYVSKQEGQQIFYRLNKELLKRIKINFDLFWDNILDEGGT